MVGRSEVARLYLGLAAVMPPGGRFELRSMNGLPTLVAEVPVPRQEAIRGVCFPTVAMTEQPCWAR